MSITERAEREFPFEIESDGTIVRVHRFQPDLDRYFEGMEQELPVLKDAIRARIDQGDTRFLFDVRSVHPFYVYPIAKWGAMLGVVNGLRHKDPGWKPTALEATREVFRQAIAIVVDAQAQREELRRSRFDEIFAIYETIEQARSALTQGPADEALRV